MATKKAAKKTTKKRAAKRPRKKKEDAGQSAVEQHQEKVDVPQEQIESGHDPENCGCVYLGNNLYSCGYIDSEEPAEPNTVEEPSCGTTEPEAPKMVPVYEVREEKAPESTVELSAGPTLATIKVNREQLLSSLKVAKDFYSKKDTLPILTNVLISARTDEHGRSWVTVLSTDLEISWTRTMLCEASSQVSYAIPLETLLSEVKALTADITDVEFGFKEHAVQVNGRCDIYTAPGTEFPVVEAVSGATVKVSLSALRTVLPAVGQNDARYVLNGALLDFEKALAVGTDGHRLHMEGIEKQEWPNIIIPKTAALALCKHGGNEAVLTVDGNRFSCKLADGEMTGKFIDGTFPNFEQVIPTKHHIRLEFSAKEMLKVFEGALPIAKNNSIKLIVNGKIEVQASHPDRGVYKWHVSGKVEKPTAEDFTIGFNAVYLVDAIKSYATAKGVDSVVMTLSEPLSPAVVNDNAVVMPVRV